MKVLEQDVKTEKAFSRLKDKQIEDAALILQKIEFEAVEKFKKSDAYSDKLYDYYVEGFELFLKYMAKHHPGFDFSTLDMEAIEKEMLADCLSTDGVASNVDDNMEDDTIVTAEAPLDPSPSNPTRNTSFISSF